MSTIIAGRFEQQPQVDATIEALERAGFPRERIASFYVNPPGQHDRYAIGGDYEKSPGAEETNTGAAAGVVAGAAAGIAATPLVGVAGPLVGAYVGSLIGGMNKTSDQDQPYEHREGLRVAVALNGSESEQRVLDILKAQGATDLERVQGKIENGDWVDFNPVEPPTPAQPPDQRS
jgi:hypothetical protein